MSLNSRIDSLFQKGKWEEARRLLKREQETDPQSHWVLTQIGVTFYEQRQYEEALDFLLASREIKDDCPLTLWNLAGVLDALGKHAQSKRIFAWLLQSKRTPKDDPCWESREWSDSLKTDCVYRLGVCCLHSGEDREAEKWFRRYVNLLVNGFNGTYSIQEVVAHRRKMAAHKEATARNALQNVVRSTRRQCGTGLAKAARSAPPEILERELRPGRRVASKK
jgi:tetratricopeptide (TPR) repeat protein